MKSVTFYLKLFKKMIGAFEKIGDLLKISLFLIKSTLEFVVFY